MRGSICLNSFKLTSSDSDHILNRKNNLGLSPLYIASRNGNLDVVKYLIEQNCDIKQKCHGESAMAVAARWNHGPVVEYFLNFVSESGMLREAAQSSASPSVANLFTSKGISMAKPCCSLI